MHATNSVQCGQQRTLARLGGVPSPYCADKRKVRRCSSTNIDEPFPQTHELMVRLHGKLGGETCMKMMSCEACGGMRMGVQSGVHEMVRKRLER